MSSDKFFNDFQATKPVFKVLHPPGGFTTLNVFSDYVEEAKPKQVNFI